MAYEHKPGTFSLFKNDKGDNPKRPDYRGDGKDMAGNDIEVSGWLKDGKKGKFLSCQFKAKGADSRTATQSGAKPAGKFDDMEDDVPF